MDILLVVPHFVPEIGSAAHLYYDFSREFVKRGHNVHVITSYPREFYLDEEDRGKEFSEDELVDGIYVHRARFNFAVRDNVVMRGIEHFILPSLYFKKYEELDISIDVCLLYLPPLPLYKFGEKIREKDGVPFVSNHQDLHPQELVEQGVVKDPFTRKFLEFIERKAYKAPDHITVMSPKEKEVILKRGGGNIDYIYNSVNLDDFKDLIPEPDFKERKGIVDKTLITYAGILSPFQGLDNILDAAKFLSSEDDVIFYIVGDGMMRDSLKQRIEDESISNVRMLPLQPREEYYNIINSSDITIVSLDADMSSSDFLIPGKIKDLMGVENPIIANVPEGNATGNIVEDYNCGIRVDPDDPEQFADAVKRIKDDKVLSRKMGRNGYRFLKKKMNWSRNVKKYEEIFKKIS